MSNASHPYMLQPERAFWRAAIGKRHYAELANMWTPMPIRKSDRIATAGSCFAQHIGNNLAIRGADWMNLEPAPPTFSSEANARHWGYGVFSCRYGNVYTTRQLVQLFDEAHGDRKPGEKVWRKHDRYFDALRPGVDPVGHDSPQTVVALRKQHLAAVRRMFAELDIFVFTLGLTEGWELISDGTMFPMGPGTVAGKFDPERHRFRNLRYNEIRDDLLAFWARLRQVNPGARMLLTVSPVPLAATATENHVLVATTYSKSVLRAVAGDLSADIDGVHYFPSYEIVSSHPARGMFFEPDLRNVNKFGVDYVMTHFFSGPLAQEFATQSEAVPDEDLELICDEEKLDAT